MLLYGNLHVVIANSDNLTEQTGTEWLGRLEPGLILAYEKIHPLCKIKQVCEDEILAISSSRRLSKIIKWLGDLRVGLYLLPTFFFLFYVSIDGNSVKKFMGSFHLEMDAVVILILFLHLIIRRLNREKREADDVVKRNAPVRKHLQEVLASLGAFTVSSFMYTVDSLCWHHNELFGQKNITAFVEKLKAEKQRLLRLKASLAGNPDVSENEEGYLKNGINNCEHYLQIALENIGVFGIVDEESPDFFEKMGDVQKVIPNA